MSKGFQRKGRDLSLTINTLMESKRLEIAVELFKKDPLLLKAILVELGNECLQVGKNTVIREAVRVWSLDAFEAKPRLQTLSNDDFCSFNIHWNMSPIEQKYYLHKIHGNLTEEEALKTFDLMKKQFDME